MTLGDRYELDGVVGRGGMAEVYRARDLRLDRTVAIKTLRADLARDQTFQARFRREAQSAASLNNPSIVAVYDTGEDLSTGTSIPFIVMEFVEGRTVRDLLIEGHRLLPERTLEIISGTLRALEYSHQAGIVHRDIKPGNVMVTRNGDIKVMDFGIARAMSDTQATMTQTAQVIGTAQYLSPEQARGERVDARSDLYSTGCLMYELLTGRPPFTGDSPVAIAYQHVRENPIPPSRRDPDIPPWADAIVLKAMAKSPNDRYQSAAEMNADIQRAASGMQVAASFQPPTRIDQYDYQQRTQRMGPQTMMGAAPTSVSQYPQGGYPPGYNDGTYDGGDSGQQRGGARRWLPWVIGVLVALAAIIVAVILLTSSKGGGTYVPTGLVGETQAQAVAQIKAAGLKPDVMQQTDANMQTGHVISTSPNDGSSIAKGGTVTVRVSAGAATIALPSVTGQQATAAAAQLQSLGFTKVVQQSDSQSTLPSGEVDHMTPAANAKYAPDQQITLYVSGGGVAVPNVSSGNETYLEAESILQADGFKVDAVPLAAPSQDGIQPGVVYNQNPSASSVKPTGSTVQIFFEPLNATPTASPSASASSSATPTNSPTPTPTGSASPTPTGSGTPTPTPPGNGGGNGGGGNGGGGNGHNNPSINP
jgi:serine/threonine-protein kinase